MMQIVDGPAILPVMVLALALALAAGYRLVRDASVAPYLAVMLAPFFICFGTSLYQLHCIHRERINVIHEEADAIAACYRATLLFDEANRRWFRSQLLVYLELKLGDLHPQPGTLGVPLEERLFPVQHSLVDRVAKMPVPEGQGSNRTTMLNNLSRMFSLHYRTRYALADRLPLGLWGFLALTGLTGAVVLGASRPNRVVLAAGLLMLSTCFAILQDMDDPVRGMIKVDTDNLTDLRGAFLRDPM